MSKVILFEKTEKNFNTRGLGILTDIVNPVITETINGIYDMSFFYPINGKLYNEITHERIVYAKGPKNYQAFRINSIEKSDLENGINVHAFHISYDLAGNFIEDTFIQNKGGDGAIKQLLAKTTTPHNFTGTSNIQETFNSRIVRENVLNILIGTAENSFLNRAGGQFERDNFRINWLTRIGQDRGVKIKYRKNLTGLTFKVDYSNVITRIMPQGFDALFLPEKYIDSPLIHQYSNIKIKNVKFDKIKSKKLNPNDKDAIDHDEALRLLRVQSKKYIEKLDKPTITADVSFIDLSQTEEYKQYKQLETIYIGDIVTVIHEPLGVELKKQMTSYQYDPILDSYIFMTLGDEKDFISGSVNSGTMALNKVEELKRELDTSILEKYKEVATDLINSGFGGYTRYYKDRMLVMDTDDVATATKVWQFNKNGIGYSKTGVQGPYVYAWTIDGVFNADFIGANSITANKLSADVGQSLDLSGNHSINLTVNENVNNLIGSTINQRIDAIEQTIYENSYELETVEDIDLIDVTAGKIFKKNIRLEKNKRYDLKFRNIGNIDISIRFKTEQNKRKYKYHYPKKFNAYIQIGKHFASTNFQTKVITFTSPGSFSEASIVVKSRDFGKISNLKLIKNSTSVTLDKISKLIHDVNGLELSTIDSINQLEARYLLKLNEFSTKIADNKSELESNFKQKADELNLTISRKANASELADKVDKDNIISEINISTEGVRIKGDRIEIEGLLTAYKGQIGGFIIGKNDEYGSWWIQGDNNFSVGMGNGSNSNGQTAFWSNWGSDWGNPNSQAWYVKNDGRMVCGNTAVFKDIAIFQEGINAGNRIKVGLVELRNNDIYYNNSDKVVWWSQQNKFLANSSDIRLKTNIEDTKINAIDIISKIRLVAFDWKDEMKGHEDIGFIAQNLERIKNVVVEKGDGYKAVNYQELIPYLTKAIQELVDENKELKSRIEEIERRVYGINTD